MSQNQINRLKVPVSISIRIEDDPDSSESQIHYINFQSTEEGYDYIIRNVILTPVLRDSENCKGQIGEFYDSPFTPVEITQDVIIDLLNKYNPQMIKDGVFTKKDNDNKINCDIYRQLLYMSLDIVADFNLFVYELDILKKYFIPCFETDGTLIFKKKFQVASEKYPEISKKYFSSPLDRYNIYDLIKIFDELNDYVFTLKNAQGPNNCYENINKRVTNLKYPNGAFRGIVMLPEWPVNEDTEYCTLLANHVADKVEICIPVNVQLLNKYFGADIISNRKRILFEKGLATVKVNAVIQSEKEHYIEDDNNLPLNDITSNDGFTNSLDILQEPGFDGLENVENSFHRATASLDKNRENDDIKYHDRELYLDANSDDTDIWENNPNKSNTQFVDSHDDHVMNTIGLYKYMEHLTKNDLWTRVGACYMNVSKKDDFQSSYRNMLQSMLIYNPNDIPIKIKYIIFC